MPEQDPTLVQHAVEIARLTDRVGQLEDHLAERLDELEKSTKALVQAWETATGIVKFVKIIAGVVTGLAGAWAILKTYWTH